MPAPRRSPAEPAPFDPTSEVLAEIRHGTLVAARWPATLVGLPVAGLFLWVGVVRAGRPYAAIPAAAILVTVVALWRAQRDTLHRLLAPLTAALALIPIAALWTVGPGYAVGAGAAVSVVLAAAFLGTWAAVAVTAVELLAFAAFGLVRGGEGLVGVPGFWRAPAWVFWAGLPSLAAYAVVVVSLMVAGVAALRRSVSALGAALGREAAEREARAEAERLVFAASRLEAIGRLASGVVHDTRNALLGLRTGVGVLRLSEGPPDPEVLDEMERALGVANETMHQLISLGGEGGAEAQELEAAPLVEHFSRALRLLVPRGVAVQVGLLAPGRVRVRRALLEQALLNLCLNARDAMPGGGRIRLGLEARGALPAPELAFEVSDEGPGLAPEVRARLFEPFVTTKALGTGLGLAMVERFVRDAGGKVEVESEPGRGTAFRLVLPRI